MLVFQHLWIILLHHRRQVQSGTTPPYPSSIQRKQENTSDWSHCRQENHSYYMSNSTPAANWHLMQKEWKKFPACSVEPTGVVVHRSGLKSSKCMMGEQHDAVCWECLHSNILWRRSHLCQSCSASDTPIIILLHLTKSKSRLSCRLLRVQSVCTKQIGKTSQGGSVGCFPSKPLS